LSDTTIARRYAAALFATVDGAEAAEGLRKGLDPMADAVQDVALRRLLDNPQVSREDKTRVLNAIGEHLGVSQSIRNLFAILVANQRTGQAKSIAREFGRMADEAAGRVQVTVTSATPLSAKARTQVDDRLAQAIGSGLDISHQVDAALLGGLVVQVGSKVFDNSIRHHLAQMHQAL